MILEKIHSPADVKMLDQNERLILAEDIRNALINRLSKKGGHAGPNFGFVDATIALHTVFDCPKDKIVFDVSHQTYPHKMLTGRKDAFLYDEHFGDISGYTNPSESDFDTFTVGHTSTSVSLATGLAVARDLKGEKFNVIAVIGDGSLSGGEAFEGLDFAGSMNSNLIIVVNDNQMSIGENNGGLYNNLELLRKTKGKAECNYFKALGLDYYYEENGNDIECLIKVFEKVKDACRPTVVHINTLKGKGFKPAELNKEDWHYCGPFDIKTGEPKYSDTAETYGSIFASTMKKYIDADKSVCVVTSGTPAVTDFSVEDRKKYKDNFFDVGIAEEHAIAMSSAISKGGAKCFYPVFSSFIQRTYDQISQDLCLDSNPATIVVFGASGRGMSSNTHLGIFDIAMMSNIPNLVYIAPTCKSEFQAMLEFGKNNRDFPLAIRVPGELPCEIDMPIIDYSEINKFIEYQKGEGTAIIAAGMFFRFALEFAKKLKDELNLNITVINPVYLTGIDCDMLENLKANHKNVITIEDGVLDGGFGEKITRFYSSGDMKVYNLGYKKKFYEKAKFEDVLNDCGITYESIKEIAVK